MHNFLICIHSNEEKKLKVSDYFDKKKTTYKAIIIIFLL